MIGVKIVVVRQYLSPKTIEKTDNDIKTKWWPLWTTKDLSPKQQLLSTSPYGVKLINLSIINCLKLNTGYIVDHVGNIFHSQSNGASFLLFLDNY